ncbi:hypothetical protein ACJRO7_032415 [Eucalyptus globulus]|uniref:Uncharacterized protein n=1 Tax=Eucalyptus globulus TaxID=34317 RepID=A0ABD3JN57_EUCGL
MTATTTTGGGTSGEGPKMVWNQPQQRFETEEKKASLRYALRDGGRVMDIVHTFVPPSKRGPGLGLPPPRLRIPTRQDQLHVRRPYLLLRLAKIKASL